MVELAFIQCFSKICIHTSGEENIVKTCSYKDGYLSKSKVASQFEDFNALSGLNIYNKCSS
jgi:predicted nucleic acid binding AN1-type Zn finger protein